jgi:hypothetical protein
MPDAVTSYHYRPADVCPSKQEMLHRCFTVFYFFGMGTRDWGLSSSSLGVSRVPSFFLRRYCSRRGCAVVRAPSADSKQGCCPSADSKQGCCFFSCTRLVGLSRHGEEPSEHRDRIARNMERRGNGPVIGGGRRRKRRSRK